MIGPDGDRESERSSTESALVLLERALTMLGNRPVLVVAASLFAMAPRVAWEVVKLSRPIPSTVDAAVTIVLVTVAVVFSTAVATQAQVAREASGRPSRRPGMGETLRALRVLPLLATGLLGGLMMVAGSYVLYVPMAFFGAWLAFAGPAVQAEGLGAQAGIARGRALVSDGRWLGLLFLVIPLALGRLLFGMLPVAFFHVRVALTHESSPWFAALMLGWTSGVDLLLLAFAAAWLGSAYVELRDVETAVSRGTLSRH